VEGKCRIFREGVSKSRPRDLILPHNTHQTDITQPISIATKHRELERKIIEEEVKVRKSWGEVRDTLLWGGRKSIDCEKVPMLRPLVLLVRVRVKVKALE
jgi:hypothetical protein